MDKFKVGDKVVRLEQFIDQHFPSTTEIHEVTESYDGNLTVKKYPRLGLYWSDYRFKLYEEPVMTNETKKPHVHAECIKAWADGSTIQVKVPDKGRYTNEWCTISDDEIPEWNSNLEYRIKPEPKPDFHRYGIISATPHPGEVFKPDGYCVVFSGAYCKQIEGTNLKLTFDGGTGKLKDAKVIG